ncbi:UbiX family flavin prenyltransferase [Paenibacillus silvae]|uniref:Flavin prenyltransferase UbiX n=1 Tax=Paenibacillus silvae TaxID=1325358 RepID=A0A2W6P4A5_9BACL|nr:MULTISPECIES: UbiX family flavin prenyltransferase [Paenibacillus]MCK6076368.1 UbiX family flavin prenyltransferase [Paenibacillus silvae]MCK6150795.1 UbiX family flavin prenyltransferase [Paenibacillus silvae]MCK6269055.1 UbiX family flavin prenyltransferase [Paenibacillus silvae]PZT54530.1 aromatic acid decarboxylase [Paenibacillus silvae]
MQQPENKRLVVGITGASGSIYGIRLIETLLDLEYTVHLVISNAGWRVLKEEMDWDVTNRESVLQELFGHRAGALVYHPVSDIGASIASGSYLAEGMIIMPCSMGTLSSIANGTSDNLMSRAADVMMKEGRTLILVPRETPLHAIHLENMLKLSRLGVRMIPAMPAFYYKPQTMDDLIMFLVGKVLDSLRIPHQLFARWGEPDERG